MRKEYILFVLKQYKLFLMKKYSVKRIGLFGSYAINKEKKESDIDIYVEFYNKNFHNVAGLWNFLERKLKKRIDLVYSHSFSNKKIIESIKRKVIYG